MTTPPFDEIAQHNAAIQRISIALCGAGPDADDVAQDLWLTALDRDELAPGSWLPWLKGSARRIRWSRQRAEWRRRSMEQQSARKESTPSTEERAMRLEVEARLLELIRSLPPAQSEVVFLRFWEGLPPRQIAKRLELPLEAVKTRQKRALAELRRRMSEETPGGREAWMSSFAAFSGASHLSIPVAVAPLLSTTALLAVKPILITFSLALVGLGIWYAQGMTGQPQPSFKQELTLEESDETRLSDPLLLAESPRPVRVSVPKTVVPDSPPQQAPSAALDGAVFVGRVFNIPLGADQSSAFPAAGIKVKLHWFLSEGPQTVTDAEGAFRLELPASEYQRLLSVRAASDTDFAHANEDLKWRKGESPTFEVNLYRRAFSGVSGVVVDQEGKPVANAKLRLEAQGVDPRETHSNEEGGFRFANWSRHSYVHATAPGLTLLESPSLTKAEDGTWNPVQITMLPSGALQLRIRDADGAPQPGIQVGLEPAPGGRFRSKRFPSGFPASLRAETDANGTALFPEAWAGLNLRLQVMMPGGQFSMERELDGILLVEPSTGPGRMIAVEAGVEKGLALTVNSVQTLACLVLGLDGQPFPNARLELLGDSRKAADLGQLHVTDTADDQGRCEFKLFSAKPLGAALLTASDSNGHFFFTWKPGSSPLAASVRLDLSQPISEEIVLTLAPTLEISGKVVGKEGSLGTIRVRAEPLDQTLFNSRLSTGFYPAAYGEKDGHFLIAGMPEGNYDIVATCSGLAQTIAKEVPAGTSGLVLHMEEESAVRVEVILETGEVPMDEYVFLSGRYSPAPGETPTARELARDRSYTEPLGWPPKIQSLWSGSGGTVEGNASTMHLLHASKEPRQVLSLDPGFYWIGAKARAQDGTQFAPMGSGLVRVTEGDYRVMLHMRPLAVLSGVVRGGESQQSLAVALSLPKGQLVPLDVYRQAMSTFVDLGPEGEFEIKQVPVGEYELRIGTREQLAANAALATRMITVAQDSPTKVTVDL